MSVTYIKLARRLQPRLMTKEGLDLTQVEIQRILRAVFFEIGDALASGEDVFLEGFGRFYLDYRPPRRICSGLTKESHMTKKKVFVRFTAFDKLHKQVQDYLKAIGIEIAEEEDDAPTP